MQGTRAEGTEPEARRHGEQRARRQWGSGPRRAGCSQAGSWGLRGRGSSAGAATPPEGPLLPSGGATTLRDVSIDRPHRGTRTESRAGAALTPTRPRAAPLLIGAAHRARRAHRRPLRRLTQTAPAARSRHGGRQQLRPARRKPARHTLPSGVADRAADRERQRCIHRRAARVPPGIGACARPRAESRRARSSAGMARRRPGRSV